LRNIGLDVVRVSRRPDGPDVVGYGDLREEGIRATPLIVNCTPVGMHPHTHAMPPLGEAIQGIGADHLVVDLIYNPRETQLLQRASALGARTLDGLSMLQHQAEAAWEIWCGTVPGT
jgi:shikimate dehydrogenase